MDPSNKTAELILAQAYADAGKDALAVQHFQQRAPAPSRDAGPPDPAAWLLATSRDPAVRDGARAVELAEHALRVTRGRTPSSTKRSPPPTRKWGAGTTRVAAMDAAIAITRATGDTQTTALYQQQRSFYAGGGRVAAESLVANRGSGVRSSKPAVTGAGA